jgi:hypothetical protein
MKRNFKVFMLAAVAVFAFAAVSSAAASAANFTTAKAPATLTATQKANQVFVTESGTVTCKKVTGTGSMSAVSQATVSTTKIAYSECSTKTIFGNIAVTVDFTTNNCNYTFHAGPPGTADITCNAGTKGVIISGPGCEVTVPAQSGLSSLTYTNTSPAIIIEPAVKNITSTGTGSLCTKTGTFTNGSYSGNVEVVGNNGVVSVD